MFTHVPESLPEDEAHARKMKNHTSETRRRDVTAHFTWSPDRTGPQNLESRRRVKIGTLSSCKMDTRIGLRAILRPLRCDRNSTILCIDPCLHSTSEEESAQTSEGSS